MATYLIMVTETNTEKGEIIIYISRSKIKLNMLCYATTLTRTLQRQFG